MALALVLNRRSQVPAENSPAFGAIAERFRRAGDLDRAVALCQEGLAKFPEHLSARVTLGWALLDLGRHKEAQAELERVIKRAPDNLAAIRGLAQLHDRMENADASDLQNPSAWQVAEEIAETETPPVLAAGAPALPELAAAAAAIEFEPAATAVVDDEYVVTGDQSALPLGIQSRQEPPVVEQASGVELDAEVERLLKAIGPPVAMTADGAPVAFEVEDPAPAGQPEPFVASAVEQLPVVVTPVVEVEMPVVAAESLAVPAATIPQVAPVAASESAIELVTPAEAVVAAASVEAAAPVVVEAASAFVAPAPVLAVELPAVQAVEAAVPAAEPVPVAKFENVPIQLVTPADAVAFRPEPVVDEELPPAAEFVATEDAAVEPVFVLDGSLHAEPAIEIAPEPAPRFAAQFISRLQSETTEVKAEPAASPAVADRAKDVVTPVAAARVAPELRVEAATRVTFEPLAPASEPIIEVMPLDSAVVELPAASSRAPIADAAWAPAADELLELLPELELAPVRAVDPVVEVSDAPLMDLIDPVATPLTIDIRPEPVTRHDIPAVVLSVRRERPAAPAPALAALEKFLRQVEVRKMQRRMSQPVAS